MFDEKSNGNCGFMQDDILIPAIRSQLDASEASNALFSACLDRALKLWQAANPDKEFWPDGADNLAWVFDRLSATENELAEAKGLLKRVDNEVPALYDYGMLESQIRAFLERNTP